MFRFLTAGESHGKALLTIIDGCPANFSLSADDINKDLARRQLGYGRGGRMKIEKDTVDIISGVRLGKTIGSPIGLKIDNRDWQNWTDVMSVENGKTPKAVTAMRPGHADLAGSLKYSQKDIRNVLERASARETAARVAAGAVAKKLLSEFKITISSKVNSIGEATKQVDREELIDQTREKGDTLGGVFEITVSNVPIGLGSYVQWDKRLDGLLARAIVSIPAVKGLEIGLGFKEAALPGSKVHDEIFYDKTKGFYHKTNNAGGLEGGVTNGEPIILRAAMKPISTLREPLASVDLISKKKAAAHVERSDVSAVEAAAVVGEAVVALVLADAFLDKFGSDSIEDISASFKAYQARLA